MIPENLLAKIEKLMAMRDHENTSQQESENAAKRIQEILMKYNIEQDTLNKALGDKAKADVYGIMQVNMDSYQTKNDANWATTLLNVLAMFNLCKVIQINGKPGTKTCFANIIGTQVNIEVLLYLFGNMLTQIKDAEKSAYTIYQGNITNRNTYKRGYYHGAVEGIYKKLRDSTEQLKKLNEGLGLMLLTTQQKLERFAKEQLGETTKGKERFLMGRDGYEDGFRKGITIEANKAIK